MNYLLQNKVNYLPNPQPVVIWSLYGGILTQEYCENILFYEKDDIFYAYEVIEKYVFDGTHDSDEVKSDSSSYTYIDNTNTYPIRPSLIINIILSFKCKDITKIKDGDTIGCTCSLERYGLTQTYRFHVRPSYINTFNIVDSIPLVIDDIDMINGIKITPLYDNSIFEVINNTTINGVSAPLVQYF